MLEILQEETGYSKDDLHAFFKGQFLGDCIQVFGEPFMTTRSTTKLTKSEFVTYLGDIRYYCFDKIGFDLPIE